jgi:hypothetical protein
LTLFVVNILFSFIAKYRLFKQVLHKYLLIFFICFREFSCIFRYLSAEENSKTEPSAKKSFCDYLRAHITNVLLPQTNISLCSIGKKPTDCEEMLDVFLLQCAIAVTEDRHTDMQPNVSVARRGIMKQYGIVGTWPNANRCQTIKTNLRFVFLKAL